MWSGCVRSGTGSSSFDTFACHFKSAVMLLKQPLNIRSLSNMLSISVLIPGLFGPTQVLSETSPTHSAKGCTSHRLFISCSRQSPEIKPASGLGRHLAFMERVWENVCFRCVHICVHGLTAHSFPASLRLLFITSCGCDFFPPSPSHFSISLSVCPSFLSHSFHPSLV